MKEYTLSKGIITMKYVAESPEQAVLLCEADGYSGFVCLSSEWDKNEVALLREQGLTQDQIGFVIGRIAEHRQLADHVGWKRGKFQT